MGAFPLLAQHISKAHKSSARVLGYALHLTGPNAWEAVSAIWAARLSPEECSWLAWAAMNSLSPEDMEMVFDAVLPSGAGLPQAALFSEMDQAAHWADLASEEELDAYCLASFNRMQADRQRAFLDHVTGRKAA